jgi:uncharacterized membrane protein
MFRGYIFTTVYQIWNRIQEEKFFVNSIIMAALSCMVHVHVALSSPHTQSNDTASTTDIAVLYTTESNKDMYVHIYGMIFNYIQHIIGIIFFPLLKLSQPVPININHNCFVRNDRKH